MTVVTTAKKAKGGRAFAAVCCALLWVTPAAAAPPPTTPQTPGAAPAAPRAPSAAQTTGGDYTTDERVLGLALNPLIGVGSFTMNDIRGGVAQIIGYSASAALVLYGLTPVDSGLPPVYAAAHTGAIYAGAGMAAATLAFGIARPLIIHRVEKTPWSEYTTADRVMGVVFNPVLGSGSLLMGDWVGWLVQMTGYAAATGLVTLEEVLDWDSDAAGVVGPIGLGVAGATLAFGIVRPLIVHRQAPSETGRSLAQWAASRQSAVQTAPVVTLGTSPRGRPSLRLGVSVSF